MGRGGGGRSLLSRWDRQEPGGRSHAQQTRGSAQEATRVWKGRGAVALSWGHCPQVTGGKTSSRKLGKAGSYRRRSQGKEGRSGQPWRWRAVSEEEHVSWALRRPGVCGDAGLCLGCSLLSVGLRITDTTSPGLGAGVQTDGPGHFLLFISVRTSPAPSAGSG